MVPLSQDDEILSDLLLYWEKEYEKGNLIATDQLCQEQPHLLEKVQKAIQALQSGIWTHKHTLEQPEDSNSNYYQYLQINTVLKNRFQIAEIIGQGNQGIVYKALDLKLDRYVAIKTSRKISNLQPHDKKTILEEAKKVAKLKHKGIVTVFDILEFNDSFLFVSEYLEGGDLLEAIKSNRLSLNEKLVILQEVALALEYAHNFGIIHRDLKPSNIILDKNLEPKICDFGISLSKENDPALIKYGALGFMAPEIINGSNPSALADIWSLGVVLFETITGELPFESSSTEKLIETILNSPAKTLEFYQPKIPKALDLLVKECLQKNPEVRLASALQFSRRISEILKANKSPYNQKGIAYAGLGFLFLVLLFVGVFLNISPAKKISEIDKIRLKKPLNINEHNLARLNQQLNSLDYWICPKKEIWSKKPDGTFVGNGIGNLTFKEPLQTGFTISFRLKVFEGIRPRLILNWNSAENNKSKFMHIGNEGFTRNIGLYGAGKKASLENFLNYELYQDLNCSLCVANEKYQAFVNDQLISEGTYKNHEAKICILSITPGDNFSSGLSEFGNFKLAIAPAP